MTQTYTPADFRHQAEALELLHQPDTAAMLRDGALALDQLERVALMYAELQVRYDALQARVASLVLELDTIP
jgi:hypothetical protein